MGCEFELGWQHCKHDVEGESLIRFGLFHVDESSKGAATWAIWISFYENGSDPVVEVHQNSWKAFKDPSVLELFRSLGDHYKASPMSQKMAIALMEDLGAKEIK